MKICPQWTNHRGKATIEPMGRSFQAYLLIAVMTLSVSANLAAMLAGSCGRGEACPPSCCGSANCPMRAHGHKMPMKCPMHSKAGHDLGSMNCCCGVSQQDTPVVSASLFELRYDLPHAQEWVMPALAAHRPAELVSASLDGFVAPPDQPPRALEI